MLEDSSVDSFAEVFLRDHTLPTGVFDDFFQCVILSCQSDLAWMLMCRVDTTDAKVPNALLDRSEHPSEADRLIAHISPILRKALSTRIQVLHIAPSTSGLTVGLVYNPSQATRVLDIGPSTNQLPETDAFRKLWGDKAELRRFKDGSISESIVWDIARPEEAAQIPSRIVRYILDRHLGLSEVDVKCLSSDQAWADIIQIPDSAREGVAVSGAEKLGFRPIMESYDELYKLLKDIDDELPLAILNVSPVTEMLRYSAPFIPHPVDLDRFASAPSCLKYVPTAEITVQFESSPRWPEDLSAIQKVKMALFEKLATLIEAKLRGSKANMVLDPSYTEIEDHVALEVLLPKGVAFKLRIFHEKEKTLLERSLEDQKQVFGTALPTPPRRVVLPALEKHLYRFHHAPKHHQGLAPLHHRYPSFSTATRLVKRWFAAHMLSLLVPAEAIELLVTANYLDPGALSAPASGPTGFVRTIKKLADWDWRSEPTLVPLFADREGSRPRFDQEKRKIVVDAFEKRASGSSSNTDSHRAWCIATEDDLEGYRWTKGISKVVAGRVSGLAKATLSALEGSVTLAQGTNVVVSHDFPSRRHADPI
jgi:U3 small nucleolar RNA-associated protein 22